MGKKYIIELEDKPFHKEDGDFLYRAKGFKSLVFGMTGIGMLTPYTEPDTEKIREAAYEDGYKTAKVQCNIQAEKDMREVGERHYQRGYETAKHECEGCTKPLDNGKAYQQGLTDAWEAARKICLEEPDGGMQLLVINDIFNVSNYRDALKDYSASEAIEKIRQYEQEQEEIKVGDEVISPDGKAVVTKISDRNVRIMYSNGSGYVTQLEELTKTGRHFSEISAILEKMRGDQNG